MNRREMLTLSGLTLAATALPSSALAQPAATPPARRFKVLVTGAHPDDPETGAGGVICLYTAAGHDVAVLYLTTGEAGIDGKSHEEAAHIRHAEALEACRIMQARPLFAGQIDGASHLDPAAYDMMRKIIEDEKPDVIFTHWPVDTHRDHRHCMNLVLDAWFAAGRKVPLYYYEVMSGTQTQVFAPTHYVDISSVAAQKHEACFVHVSQKIRETYAGEHGRMEVFRGMEAGCQFAEAYIRHSKGPEGRLP
jgi:LmbE family N-acetylglucosaminyl deacetylase